MSTLRYAHEYEVDLGDGYVQVYAGHPNYCQQPERHGLHVFHYQFRLRDGSSMKGSYLCKGEPQTFPVRYMDKELDDATS